MIRKSEYFELTDKYLDAEMSEAEVSDFETHMEIDSELADELSLHLDVKQALAEKDIINLREKLNQIVQNQTEKEMIGIFNSFNFGLSEEFSSHKNLGIQPNTDLQNITQSFPKIHLYQQQIASKENIHQFYKEQFNSDSKPEDEILTPYEENLFIEIQDAMEENDILDIRANLKQIAQSMPAHIYSVEEIDSYVYNQMESELRSQFENELSTNIALAHDVQIIKDIDLACEEIDIMNLRAALNKIQKTEFQSSSRIEEIEGYIYNELSEEEMVSFETELSTNKTLSDEIELIRNIDLALKESEVIQLRNNLQNIATKIASEKQTELSFITRFKARKVILSSIAASLILLLGITGLLTRQASQDKLYQKFYAAYHISGINRSANESADLTLASGLQKFDNQEYEAALNLLKEVTSRNKNNTVAHFYTGASFQETGKYQDAISEFQMVIADKDNLFIEQAQWYIGLCYLQTNENKKAYKQFNKIAENQGFYQPKAQAILRKMNYSED
jgi:hypothetical protein